jgi:hypothetical protein
MTRFVHRCLAVAVGLMTACGPQDFPTDEADSPPGEVNFSSELLTNFAQHSLLLNILPTVNDPSRTSDPCLSTTAADANKKWTFGYLMTQVANQAVTGVTPNTFVKEWLRTFSTTQTVNGNPLPAVGLGAQIEEDWRLKSAAPNGALLMQHAPFRLLAIVVRFDLRKNRRFGEGLGGELRFVFGHLRLQRLPEDGTGKCTPGDGSTINLEYAVDRADENQVLAWARSWNALMQWEPHSEIYRQEVEKLTESVVRAGVSPNRPNRSSLIRIRSNGNHTQAPTWDLREWVIDANSRLPKAVTVKQSPKMSLITSANPQTDPRNATEIGTWINQNEAALLADTYTVPDKFPGTSTSFLGGFQTNDITHTRIVRATNIVNNEARHSFAKGTCVGCHSVETGSSIFHIRPRRSDEEAELSDFMTGGGPFQHVAVTDPVDGSTRFFGELTDRESDVTALINEWQVVPLKKLIASNGQPAVNGQNYKIRFGHSGKCIDIASNSIASGARVQQWTCNGNGNQRVMVEDQGGGFSRLRFKHSGQCADVPATGTQVVQRPCANTDAQKVTLEQTRGFGFVARFKASNKCLEVQAASGNNGTNVIQNTCRYDSSQTLGFVE